MKKIALFYGSTTCYTEMAAEKIVAEFAAEPFGQDIPMFNIKETNLSRMEEYDVLILGISTWDFGELQEDWESQWQDIAQVNLAGKIIALYGLGDQMGYADWFQDALGMLHDEVIVQDCVVIGYWPNEGYEFSASKALTEGDEFFVGLSLDDENQYDETDQRIASWVQQVYAELAELSA
ncbi:flavodoxin FldB [Planctobacterium marinum]|uniref:flavodoxin FldB n=1 Tax=Planctobacterium marinum TaxID=1631968 RepID=UPI00226C6C45|nr:flavodoxin FldB [Planctobacterium marinum]MCC2605243.1 flavodoxin FldB [Planctobacterium marinum]